jgi:hypothetical protein
LESRSLQDVGKKMSFFQRNCCLNFVVGQLSHKKFNFRRQFSFRDAFGIGNDNAPVGQKPVKGFIVKFLDLSKAHSNSSRAEFPRLMSLSMSNGSCQSSASLQVKERLNSIVQPPSS